MRISKILTKKADYSCMYTRTTTTSEEIAFTARPNIQFQSQIFRYGQSKFCLPHRPNFSDIFDLCLHWVSVVRAAKYTRVLLYWAEREYDQAQLPLNTTSPFLISYLLGHLVIFIKISLVPPILKIDNFT
jgi:hypothetical protein